MSLSPRFPVEPWNLREIGLDIGRLAQSESLFALSNGHIGLRGNLDEGDPSGLPGTYLNSFYESRPLPYAEAGYGFPESGQTILNVTNGKLIRLLVDDEPFDMRYGTLVHHERILDFRAGTLRRVVEWTSPARRTIRVRSTRLVSLTQRSIVAIKYEIEAVDSSTRAVIQSELVANEHIPAQSKDPRVSAMMDCALVAEEQFGNGTRALLVHRSRQSRLLMAAAMEHVIEGPNEPGNELALQPDWARVMAGTTLHPGQTMTVTKFIAYGWSSQRSVPALRDQVDAALSAVMRTGWDQLVDDQAAALDLFWRGADVEVDGDPVVQQAVRFSLFHTYQAAARAEQRAIPAKGLTGPGYDGHAFWDTESFVLPVLTATAPHAATDALTWRHSTLGLACERAKQLLLCGAAFPWRTIRGQECSAYWPAGTAALHINADIADAMARHVLWTGDREFERRIAVPVLVETARLFISYGCFGRDGQFHLDGVTGPDEYSALVDDNVYTNLMARRALRAAAAAAERCTDEAAELAVTAEEVVEWCHAAEAMAVPFNSELGVHSQDKDFTDHEVWDFESSAEADAYPLLLHAPYFDIYRKQVIKQADLVLALHWCGNEFTLAEKAAAFAYYDPLTVRDSSLSASTQAVIAAEVGHRELAHEYLVEAALMDLHDLEHNTGDGLHIASLAGAWIALVAGFGGMRDNDGSLSFHPQLPAGMSRLAFNLHWRDAALRVVVTADEVEYSITAGSDGSVQLGHCGEVVTVAAGAPVRRPVHLVEPLTPRPPHPPGRDPYHPER